MDRKRSRDPDEEDLSPSGKRMHRNPDDDELRSSFVATSNAMQAVAHEALAMTNGAAASTASCTSSGSSGSSGGGSSGFSAINIPRTPVPADLTARDPVARSDNTPNGFGHATSLDPGNTPGPSQPPFASMSDITRCFRDAVDKAWGRRSPTYAAVHVLLIFWDCDADSVHDAVAQLESVFRSVYRFATEIYAIRSTAACDKLYAKVDAFFASHSSSGDLAILYYAGQIEANRQAGHAPVWTPRRPRDPTLTIESRPIQAACEAASCDVLLLFDFSNAYLYPLTQASYVTARRNVIEVLDAPTFDADVGSITFTKALIDELTVAVSRDGPIKVESLKTLVSNRMAAPKPRGRGRPPKDLQTKSPADLLHLPKHYFLFQRRSIVLTPLPAEPQIVLCLRILNGSLDLNQWGKWIYNASPEARDAVQIEGLHSGFATMIVLRVPVSEWRLFSECPAGSFVGYTTIGDIDPATLDEIDRHLAAKLWPEDVATSPRTLPPSASATDLADLSTPATPSYPAPTAGSLSPATVPDGDADASFSVPSGQKRARKALPTERKILPSEPSPGIGRRKEYGTGDDRKTKESPHHHHQSLSQQEPHGLMAEMADSGDKSALLAAAAQKPFKISIKLAGQTHVCRECKAGFKDADSLHNHVRKLHTRPFHCVFHWAGCESTFASKNEWKRHVMSQHILLQYWVCQVETCSKVVNRVNGVGGVGGVGGIHGSDNALNGGAVSGFSLPNGAIFNRKDLFTQHLRRMHTPPHVKKLLKQAKQGAKMPSHASIVEWENRLKELQQDGLKPRCRLPDYMVCPAEGCGIDFHGNNAWDDRMEHVARHLEASSAGREPPVVFGGKTDTTLTEWATRPEVGIAKRVGPNTWHLDNPLRPEIMAWTEEAHHPDMSQERPVRGGSGGHGPGLGLGPGSGPGSGPVPGSGHRGRERSRSVIEVAEEDRRPDGSDRRMGRGANAGIPVN